MKIIFEIPKEFENHFLQDVHCLAGNYEQEIIIMLIKVFKNAKIEGDEE